MTIKEYIEKIKFNNKQLEKLEKETGRVVATIHAAQVKKIFTKGINAKYSSRPILAGSNVFGSRNRYGRKNYTFATSAGSRKFFSKRRVKSGPWVRVKTSKGYRSLLVIPGGYKAIRQADGRKTNRVNLNHTGVLFKNYASSLTKVRGGWITGVSKENVGKVEGSINRYGEKVWELTDKELAPYREELTQKLTELIA
jgi:hypothetical protein